MKEYKRLLYILGVLIVFFLVVNSIQMQTTSTTDFDSSLEEPGSVVEIQYVEETKNSLVILAKYIDRVLFYIVDSSVNLVGKVFEILFGI